MNNYQDILELTFLSNTVREYLIALGIFLVLFIVLKIFEKVVVLQIKRWAKKTKTDLDDEFVKIIETVPHILYIFIAFYIGLRFLQVHEMVSKIVEVVLIVLIIYWVTKVATDLIEYALNKSAKQQGAKKGEKTTTYFALSLIAKIGLWSIGLLLVLSNLGVNISALIASLGIGGIAIALAAQNILSDMFSSFSLYFDKPFDIGDYIIVGDQSGTVKKIGIKTTRVQALQGEEIVFSNRELTTAQVRNFKKMKKRRISFPFGVTYDTSSQSLKKIPKMLKEIFKKTKLVDLDRVHFKEFGDFSLNFEVVYYIKSSEYIDFMNAQQKINLAIVDAFEKEKIEMAFPTQTVYLNKEG